MNPEKKPNRPRWRQPVRDVLAVLTALRLLVELIERL
jgi:hypothetical protein